VPVARSRQSRVPTRLTCPGVDRNTLMWTLVIFFGASLMFAAIRNATEEGGVGLVLAAQLAAGALLVTAIVLYVRRRR
jgi:hypothetical protein